jgi:hypothetical protein
MPLVLRRGHASRISGSWQDEDYDVFDGDRDVGRIYLVHAADRAETWYWGVSFQITKRKSYGYESTLAEASAAFRVEYEGWKGPEIEPAG